MLRCSACGSNCCCCCCCAKCITGIVDLMYRTQPEILSRITWATNGHANCCWSGCAACLDVHIACLVSEVAKAASSAGRVLMFVHHVCATWLERSTKRTSSQDHVELSQNTMHLLSLVCEFWAWLCCSFFLTNARVHTNVSAQGTHTHSPGCEGSAIRTWL